MYGWYSNESGKWFTEESSAAEEISAEEAIVLLKEASFERLPQLLRRIGLAEDPDDQVVSSEGIQFLTVKMPTARAAVEAFLALPADFNYLKFSALEAEIEAASHWDVWPLAERLWVKAHQCGAGMDIPRPEIYVRFAPEGKIRTWVSYTTASKEMTVTLDSQRHIVTFEIHRGADYYSERRGGDFINGVIEALQRLIT